ncbi:DUF421 domain-containing protein [Virgibacillus siamensis]|uniref:DUF421 domain-containing protein n=1 Tax=Virgibacillus siamensis TaxID=480071 RepID=UPI0009861CB2|nr:DUF421 domain-containing protein [Virgibacillus siamensis]
MFENLDIAEMLVRTTVTFLILLLLTRLMGRKQLSQLTFFNYITGITIGSIAADLTSEASTPFFNGLTSLIWWAFLTILIGYIGLKQSKIRVITDGQPVIVIKNGKILENELKHMRLNMDDLIMLLREQNVLSPQDVDYATLEPNGKLAVILKTENQPATKQDTNSITVQPTYIPTKLVSDGHLIEKNVKNAGITKEWLKQQLQAMNIALEDVFYVEMKKDGTLFVDKRNDNMK